MIVYMHKKNTVMARGTNNFLDLSYFNMSAFMVLFCSSDIIAVIRQQFVMGIMCSIFLCWNSFRANQSLALTWKSFRIVQVSGSGSKRVMG